MGRRTKGDGSLFQRKDGMWVGRVELPPKDGKRRYKYVSSMDWAKCTAKLKKVRTDVDEGRIAVTGSTTVERWMKRWIEDIHAPRLRPNTLLDYRAIIDNHIIPTLGKKRLDKLTPDHVRQLHKAIGPSRTAEVAHTVLGKALKDAIREQMITRNVCELVDKPVYTKTKRTSLSVGIAKRILAEAEASCDESQATRWMAALFTGARQGELLGLRWSHVDLDAGMMDISWQMQRLRQEHGCGEPVDGKYPCDRVRVSFCPQRRWNLPPNFEHEVCVRSHVWTRPKSEAGIREVPLITPLWARFSSLHANQGFNPHGLVFHEGGEPIDKRIDSRRWNELLQRAGVVEEGKTFPLHTARHTTATLLRAAGVDEQTRMEILGHATVDSQRVYAHADQQRHQVAMSTGLKELLS
jgi:integrase